MHIDDYDMGFIVVDGVRYETDVLLLDGQVIASWWRKESHVLAAEDLDDVAEAPPEILIAGTGKFGRLSVPAETAQFLAGKGIGLEVHDTRAACDHFNKLTGEGRNVAAALHLTC